MQRKIQRDRWIDLERQRRIGEGGEKERQTDRQRQREREREIGEDSRDGEGEESNDFLRTLKSDVEKQVLVY